MKGECDFCERRRELVAFCFLCRGYACRPCVDGHAKNILCDGFGGDVDAEVRKIAWEVAKEKGYRSRRRLDGFLAKR